MKKKIRSTLLVLLIVALLAACGSSDMAPASAEPAAPAADAPARAVAPAPALAESSDFAFEAEADVNFSFRAESAPDSDYFSLPILTPSDAGDRRLIYTVSMQLQTTEFLPGMRLLLDTVAEADGYLVSADVRGSDLRRTRTEQSAVFRFRIPTEGLASLIFVVENNYNILSLQQGMQEETAQYQQTGWTLDDLREQESELLEILETAEGEAYTAANDRLREVRRSIRELEASQAAIMSNVIYSTVDIQLSEVLVPDDIVSSPITVIHVLIAIFVIAVLILIVILVKTDKNKRKEDR